MAAIERMVSSVTRRFRRCAPPPATEAAIQTTMQAMIHSMVLNAGENGVFTCQVNGHQLNVPSGLLSMFRHCLHVRPDQPLTYMIEELHLRWLCERLSPGDVAVDVGASGGLLTAGLARTVGAGGRVYSFEPARRAFRLLSRLVQFNELANVVVENQAVSNSCGSVDFAEFPFTPDDPCSWRPETSTILSASLGAEARSYSVQTTTLDDYFAASDRPVRAIKIDVEGFETCVLAGAGRTLARDRPVIAIDIHRRVDGVPGDTEPEVRERLSSHGYRCQKLQHVLLASPS